MSSSETTNPLIVWQRLRTGNDHLYAPLGRRDEPASDRQVAAVFGCSDSGLCGQQVFGQSRDSLIDIKNWGHVIDSGVIATLEYAVETREVPLIVVLGHQDCDAIRTAMQAWSDAVLPGGATRTVVEHVIGSIVRRGTEAESADAVAAQSTLTFFAPSGKMLLDKIVRMTAADQGGGLSPNDARTCRKRPYAHASLA
jgi:carbonic anhydrase